MKVAEASVEAIELLPAPAGEPLDRIMGVRYKGPQVRHTLALNNGSTLYIALSIDRTR